MSRVLAALLLLGLLTACGGGGGATPTFSGQRLDQPYPPPSQQLTDTGGSPYTFTKDATAPLTLVFFGYTHCPDICPLSMANVASALVRLTPAQREQVDVVFVTTDPARDDTQTLRYWLDRFDKSFVGLTADLDTLVAVAKDYAVFIGGNTRLPSGGYEVEHSTPVLGLDDHGRAIVVWTEGFSSAALAADIATLLKERP